MNRRPLSPDLGLPGRKKQFQDPREVRLPLQVSRADEQEILRRVAEARAAGDGRANKGTVAYTLLLQALGDTGSGDIVVRLSRDQAMAVVDHALLGKDYSTSDLDSAIQIILTTLQVTGKDQDNEPTAET